MRALIIYLSFIIVHLAYIAITALFLLGLSVTSSVTPIWLDAIGVAVIAVLGIPHGALDLEIAKRESDVHPVLFIVAYLSVMGALLLLWFVAPLLSLVIFLLVSAYHFGQSQLADLDIGGRFTRSVSYLVWGAFIFSALFLCCSDELAALMQRYPDFNLFSPVLQSPTLPFIAISSGVGMFIFLLFNAFKGTISRPRFFIESAVLLSALISFYFLPLVIAFSLYFCIMHSARVMADEKDHLTTSGVISGWGGLLRLLAPMTILSLVGIALIAYLSFIGWMPISPIMTVLILTSLVTLPHCGVMELFYLSRSKVGEKKESTEQLLSHRTVN